MTPRPPRVRWARRIAIALVALPLLAWVAIVALVYFGQEGLIFHPQKLAPDYAFTLPGVVEEKIAVPGAELSALHFRLPNPKGVVFFLHGNGGNLQSWVTGVDFYRRVNYDLVMIDYRGYGKSTGRIDSEAQLHADVRAAWDRVAQEYAGKKRVVYGRSLGTGLAARLSAEVQPDLTVLVSPYSSLLAMGSDVYPWLPSFINRYTMRSDRWVTAIRNPVLILHGDKDSLIPIAQARLLMEARSGTEMVVVPEAGHNDIHQYSQYLDTLARKLAGL